MILQTIFIIPQRKIKGISASHFLLFLLLLCSSIAIGQTGAIGGRVTDAKTGLPLSGATVVIEGTPDGTLTDHNGNFLFKNIPVGTHRISGSYLSYRSLTKNEVGVRPGDTARVEIALAPEGVSLKAVEILGRTNRETENILLAERRKSLVPTQAIGARELSRKGIDDAEAAVLSAPGISKQQGVKNVFVRGLGDRYNATLLNGMPVPSEDPEHKNIALTFFGADMIQSIGVNKVFSAASSSDVGGAVIDITSKQLYKDYSFGLEISGGFNTRVNGVTFLQPSGSGYFGFTKSTQPSTGKFDFINSLDPSKIRMPLNEHYKLSGGRLFLVGRNPLSLFVVATDATENSYTKEIVQNINTTGTVYRNQTGQRFSGRKSQLILANANYRINGASSVAYNFMMLHVADRYLAGYTGRDSEKHQDGNSDEGYLRRQQINDNLLFTHQFLSKWSWAERWNMVGDVSVNLIKGLEPDRRENYFSMKTDGSYGLTGSNRQKRFFSALHETGYHAKLVFNYQLDDPYGSADSKLSLGYNGRFSNNDFEATEYNFTAIPGAYWIDRVVLDDLYNASNYEKGLFSISRGNPNRYTVSKNVHSIYTEGVYRLSAALTGSMGLRFDYVDMHVAYDIPGSAGNNNGIVRPYYLPYLNLKYEMDKRNAIRFGASKTYTLPQSKEISPYQYVNIGFASEGNPDIRPSDNYNLDLRWDNYLSASELLSVAVFYKRIKNPIGRVDKGNSAGLLTYDNISKFANVSGVELEIRKSIFAHENTLNQVAHKLSLGLNASLLHTALLLDLTNTPKRKSGLEGASPFIVNTDVSYYYSNHEKRLTTALIFNYFSGRIYTNGTLGFQDIIEEGVPSLDLATSFQFNRKFSLKFKAVNLSDPFFTLTRRSSLSQEKIILNQYKRGIDMSLGVSIDL